MPQSTQRAAQGHTYANQVAISHTQYYRLSHYRLVLSKAFSTLTLLGGCQEEHPACKN